MAVIDYVITVASKTDSYYGSDNAYYYNGEQQPLFTLYEGNTYRFYQSDSSNNGHLLRFHTVEDGTHASGGTLLDASAGFTTSGVPGLGDANPSYSQLVVTSTTPRNLHYFCTNHSGMGGHIQVYAEPEIYDHVRTDAELSLTTDNRGAL